MKQKYLVLVGLICLTLSLTSAGFGQKSGSQTQLVAPSASLTLNDQLVLHALRSIYSAEVAYSKTYGNSVFANLQNLRDFELVDPTLGSGQKHGYRFTVVFHHVSMQTMGGFDVTATPLSRQFGGLSFYMNESCHIRGAARSGRDATINDPIVEPCGTSQLTDNEKAALSSIRQIHGAETTYQATYGAGQFGTLDQLYNAELTNFGFAMSSIYRGYVVTAMTITPGTMSTPARFALNVVPQQYGRSGARSFYIDESGVIHGGDKGGAPADQNDPPVADQF